MVRYNEILNENNAVIKYKLIEYFRPAHDRTIWREGETYEIVDGKVNILREADGCIINRFDNQMDELPIRFGSVFGIFDCRNVGLKTLKGCPTKILPGNYDSIFRCNNNQLTSLQHLPDNINAMIQCENNPFTSLEGLTENTKALSIDLTYSSDLPLLRLLLSKQGNAFFKDKSPQKEAQEVEKIINDCIATELNLKKRILDCQYALIKAGYKGNAKW